MVKRIYKNFGEVKTSVADGINRNFINSGYKRTTEAHYKSKLVSEITYVYYYLTYKLVHRPGLPDYTIVTYNHKRIIAQLYIYPKVRRQVSNLTTIEFVNDANYSGESLVEKLGGENMSLGV